MLTATEEYIVEQSIELYNQILFTKFYKLIWKSQPIMVAWDTRNKLLVSVLVGYLEDEDLQDLNSLLYGYET